MDRERDEREMSDKALLLAAGLGSRLRPLTYDKPKCLVPVKGLPVIGHWLHLLEKHGYREVVINTGYQADQVNEFLDTFYSPLQIRTSFERELLGTGGTIRANWAHFEGSESFLVAHVDNFTNANLTATKTGSLDGAILRPNFEHMAFRQPDL